MLVVKLDVFAMIFDQRFGRSRVENGKMNDNWFLLSRARVENGKMHERVGKPLYHQVGILWNCGIVRLEHSLDHLNPRYMQQG